jgi:hypothetical protein
MRAGLGQLQFCTVYSVQQQPTLTQLVTSTQAIDPVYCQQQVFGDANYLTLKSGTDIEAKITPRSSSPRA